MLLNRLMARRLDAFQRAFAYDVTYLREILATSRRAFVHVGRLNGLAGFRESIPLEPWYAAKIVATLHEDCGPCTQLVADMALKAGVAGAVVRAVVAGQVETLSPETQLGYRFARAVLARSPVGDDLRDEVVRRWGHLGLVSLACGIAGSRLYPTLKYALGHGRACSVVRIHDERLAVAALQPAASP